ncbi:hypothetical protein CK503_06855 [Aliifodinibius salipaludis]|uniref:Outer membrane protein beta-barrel domain-containing protein n=1 Tax=Fodinibius salipaludis TaxID=2032627 RepID=A0A2A2GCB6_9BACT|nr:hypothetical protein [Aliifodinibius salipaludis]PAU94509.1 hypothetical protein CK503_06855 [Aliifodinibius salipaludis]
MGLPLILVASFSQSYSQGVQKTDSHIDYWVQGGPSVTTLGTGLQAELMVDYNNHLFSISTTSTDVDFGTEIWDIALIYGQSMNYRSFYLSAGTGVAVIGGNGYSDLFGRGTKTSIETTIGFPLRGQISWQPVRFFALGINSFLNVNTEQPFGGIGISVRIGKFQGL